MADDLPKVGLRLVAENAEAYQSALQKSFSVTNQFTGAIHEVGLISTAVSMAVGQVMAQAFISLTQSVAGAIVKLIDFGGTAIMAAGRYEQLMTVAYQMGAKQGYTNTQIDEFVKSVRSMGIEAAVAADLIAQFVRYNIDLSKASELARVAQDAAKQAGLNSSEALQMMIHGIVTGQTEVIRMAGIQLDMVSTTKKLIAAGDAQSKTQMMVNAVLEEGKKIEGNYEASLTSGLGVMQSWPRVANDILIAIGTPFQTAFFNVSKTVYELGLNITKLVSEGGALYPILQSLGAGAAVITE